MLSILQKDDIQTLRNFVFSQKNKQNLSELEISMEEWSSPWRMESLEHYLSLGWSFGFWEKEKADMNLKGYFLAQPLLFFARQTQSLWLEDLNGESFEIKEYLLDSAYRLAKEKHFQKLFIDPKALGSDPLTFIESSFFSQKKQFYRWVHEEAPLEFLTTGQRGF